MVDQSLHCIQLILRPVVRLCLRRSLKLQEIVELIKQLLVEEAAEILKQSNETPNSSKVCVMTGVHRKDVARLLQQRPTLKKPVTMTRRVIERWQQDATFRTKSGKARVLTTNGAQSEFFSLVQSVSRDLNPATVLNELERIGLVVRTSYGAKLVSRVFNPRGEPTKGYELLARDTSDLITAVDENINLDLEVPNLHIKTEYDNILESALPNIRKWMFEEGSAFHQRLRNYLSQFDKDINKEIVGPSAARVVVGSFSLTSKEAHYVK